MLTVSPSESKATSFDQNKKTREDPYFRLLEKIKKKQITVGVIGLGYVGLPLAMVFAEAGVRALGFDVDSSKIKSIHSGKSYFRHLERAPLKKLVEKNAFSATTNFERVSECEAIIICVPTPLTNRLDPDLSYIEKTCINIAPHLTPHSLICLESTTWPGTTEEVVGPLLKKHSPLKNDANFYLAFSPEREDPGNEEYTTKNIPKLVGGSDEKSLQLAKSVYSLAIDDVVALNGTQVAEAAKLLENIFRSVNIALVNELKMIFDKMDIDIWEVIRGAATKPFGYMPFWPGPGLGGHCIPIDPFYLSWKAKEFGIRTRFIELAGEINRKMPKWVLSKIQDCLNEYGKPLKGSHILLIGLAYKGDIEDMRESPSLELIRLMEDKGAKVSYYDPMIPKIPRSREYSQLENRTSAPPSEEYDCFVLSTVHQRFSQEEFLRHGVPIIDTRNFFPKHKLVFPA